MIEPVQTYLALDSSKQHSFHPLADYANLRCLIERDYEELKQEVGLGDFEGRGWRGFHHHATLSIAVYGFLILISKGGFSPSRPLAEMLIQNFAIPNLTTASAAAA